MTEREQHIATLMELHKEVEERLSLALIFEEFKPERNRQAKYMAAIEAAIDALEGEG